MKKTVQLDDDTLKLMKRISINLKDIRRSRGLTQSEMSQYGFNNRWYQRLESGKHIPTLPTLIKLGRALDAEVIEFFR